MRIVGGEYRGRRLEAPKDQSIRPTSDRARESIFNLLRHHAPDKLDGPHVLDLYAGSGALAFEALSRGAGSACLVDNSNASLALARRNAETLGVIEKVTFLRSDARRMGRAKQTAALIFCDAPYGKGLTEAAIRNAIEHGWVAEGAVFVIEVGADETVVFPGKCETLTERTYGAAKVVLIRSLQA